MVIIMNKKHVSRKLKSSWRKHIDISDVEKFLEEQRQDERTGQTELQPDSELFQEEKKPHQPKATLREIRKKKFDELPRSLLPLVNTSKVSDPVVKRNVKKIKTPFVCKTAAPVKIRKHSRPSGIAKAKKEDIWAQDSIPEELKSEWINRDLVFHTLKHVGKPLITKLPERCDKSEKEIPLKKKLPAGGISYNPAINDYIRLKNKVVKQEKAVIKKEEHFDRVVTNMIKKISPEEQYRLSIQEMSEGLLKAEKGESEDEEVSPTDAPIVIAKRKKCVSKMKKKLQEQKLQEAKLLKQELQKFKEIDRVDEINREIQKEQTKASIKAKRKANKTKKQNNAPIDFIEPGQLSGSLRTIQPLNNLISTGIMKARKISILTKTRAEVARKTRQPKMVRYTRSSHKVPLSEREDLSVK